MTPQRRQGSRRSASRRTRRSLDKDFQLFYAAGDKDVGLTALTHRPIADEDGYFMLLVSPRVELSKEQQVPRDMVLVLDTSGSMRGVKMEQARKALKYCLDNLDAQRPLRLINFATTVNKYRDKLLDADTEQLEQAQEVGRRPGSDRRHRHQRRPAEPPWTCAPRTAGRPFTIVFFTDGQPTIGETNPDKILKNVAGEEHRQHAHLHLRRRRRRQRHPARPARRAARGPSAPTSAPAEDIEAKVSSLYGKISHPVLTNLKLTAGDNVQLQRSLSAAAARPVPRQPAGRARPLHRQGPGGGQADRQGRQGDEGVRLRTDLPRRRPTTRRRSSSTCGRGARSATCSTRSASTARRRNWSTRWSSLAKKYGITTPYTSYLVVPDARSPLAAGQTAPAVDPIAFGAAGGGESFAGGGAGRYRRWRDNGNGGPASSRVPNRGEFVATTLV